MARTQSGLPGVYNVTALSLADGEGAALALDSAGKPILSPLSSFTNAISGGQTIELKVENSQMRQYDELAYLKQTEINMNALLINEPYAQNMGFEIY